MEIITRRQRMSSVSRKLRREDDKTIGLVPTMGALHEGHLSLGREARRMCDIVVVASAVNPTEFGRGQDCDRYPRNLTQDPTILVDYNVDYIFAHTVEEVYPKNFSTSVTVEGVSTQLEGQARPNHFRGVATVVTILFNITRPDFAFFGQKDAQQTAVVKRLVRDLAFDTEIVILPTVREVSGLAMSSRNAYLDDRGRRAATILHRALKLAEAAYTSGERSAKRLIEIVRTEIEAEPQARLEYVSVIDAETFERLEKIDDHPALIAVAVYIGTTRLIDNIVLHSQTQKQSSVLNSKA